MLGENYFCDGQMTISEWLQDIPYEERYPIPKLSKRWLDEEGWVDTWHYADKEKPPKDDYYYTVWLMKNGEYSYQYSAYSDGEFYVWNSTTKKWQPKYRWYDFIIAWVRLPKAYEQDEAFIKRIGADIDKEKYKRWE